MSNLFESLTYDLNVNGMGFVVGADVDGFERENDSAESNGEGFFKFILDKCVDSLEEPEASYLFGSEDSDAVFEFCSDVINEELDIRNCLVVVMYFEEWDNKTKEIFYELLNVNYKLGSIILIKDPLDTFVEDKLTVII